MVGYAVGVDLGGTNLRVAVVDEQGRMLEKLSTSTTELRTPARYLRPIRHVRRFFGMEHLLSSPVH
jgi:predicted NBD/HSP70 family sugar kinase